MSVRDNDEELKRARKQAIRILSRRAYAVAELRLRLERKGFESRTVDSVIDWLTEIGYLDDSKFAAEWVEFRLRRRPSGRWALEAELKAKGIDPALAAKVVNSRLDREREAEIAARLARETLARYSQLPVEERKSRVFRLLQRRGFPYEVIVEAVAPAFDGCGDECGDGRIDGRIDER